MKGSEFTRPSQKLIPLASGAQISYRLSLWSAVGGIATKCCKRHVQPRRCSPPPRLAHDIGRRKVRSTSVQVAAHFSSAATASGMTSAERYRRGLGQVARTTRRIIFMVRRCQRSSCLARECATCAPSSLGDDQSEREYRACGPSPSAPGLKTAAVIVTPPSTMLRGAGSGSVLPSSSGYAYAVSNSSFVWAISAFAGGRICER